MWKNSGQLLVQSIEESANKVKEIAVKLFLVKIEPCVIQVFIFLLVDDERRDRRLVRLVGDELWLLRLVQVAEEAFAPVRLRQRHLKGKMQL